MMKAVLLLILQFCLFGCTLLPSDELIESDKLKSNLSLKDMNGTFLITQSALNKLEDHYNFQQIDSMKFSTIEINSKDSTIKIQNAPLNKTIDGEFVISSGVGKLYVTGWNHEKFRFIERPDSQYPNMKFRQKNGKKSILINLDLDPDSFDYYEYILQK